MRKRSGDTIIEILIAFMIIIFAISISVLASAQVNELKKEAVIKSHIYDVAYSAAEEQLSTSTILPDEVVTIKYEDYVLTFEVTSTTASLSFFGKNATSATVSVRFKDGNNNEDDDYKIEMLVIPKQ